jgi:CxxC-x17-CxxC domain-containing protein
MVEFQDLRLTCQDCGADFVWSAGEQTFFADKGLTHQPKRCKTCKTQKNHRFSAIARHWRNPHEQVAVPVVCYQCGMRTTVPFRPTQGRPVYCRACFLRKRATYEANPPARARGAGRFR